jgi:cation:H+ antiporter
MIDGAFWFFVLAASLVLLIKSADYFLKAAEHIGIFLGIPSFIIGVTIVAAGTSLPELAASVVSVLAGNSEIVAGNVIGSNIANILLVLGIAAIVNRQLRIEWEIIKVDLPLLALSALLLLLCVMDGVFTFPEALFCIFGLLVYLGYTISMRSSAPVQKEKVSEVMGIEKKISFKDPLMIIIGIIGLYIGANYTVVSVIELSALFGIATSVIAASAVALGTSLPEVMVSLTALRRSNPEIAIANILGSNIFNTFGVMGVAGLVGTLVIDEQMLFLGMPLLLGSTLLFFFSTQDKEVSQWEGWLFLSLYVFFIAKLFHFI